MMHHIFILFLFDLILYEINLHIIPIPYFNISQFKNGWIYIYEIPHFEIILQFGYLLLGILGPLALHYIYDTIKKNLNKRFSKIV